MRASTTAETADSDSHPAKNNATPCGTGMPTPEATHSIKAEVGAATAVNRPHLIRKFSHRGRLTRGRSRNAGPISNGAMPTRASISTFTAMEPERPMTRSMIA